MGEYQQVAEWLKSVDDEDSESRTEDGTEIQVEPHTPRRQRSASVRLDEISPTNTSFSTASIFDIPFREIPSPQSPCAGRSVEDNVSETSSFTQDYETEYEVKEQAEQHLQDLNLDLVEDEQLVQDHDGSATNIDENLNQTQATNHLSQPQPITTSSHRLVTIVSCLQCTLSNLPCSRTPPICTRCKRNNNTNNPLTPCLLYRRRCISEFTSTEPSPNSMEPVLLRLPEENPEQWNERVDLAQELCARWEERRDKQNWVFSSVESCERGGWRGGEGKLQEKGKRRGGHPGEGEGRVVYVEMRVE